MPCDVKKDADGHITGFVCRSPGRQRCHYCTRLHEVLCDYPVTSHASGTCDRPCCRAHAERVGPDRDYCLTHANLNNKLEDQSK